MNEKLYICQPDGLTAFRCVRESTDAELEVIGFQRVVWRTVMVNPPVCPVNGAEFGDKPYPVRRPYRQDGTRLSII